MGTLTREMVQEIIDSLPKPEFSDSPLGYLPHTQSLPMFESSLVQDLEPVIQLSEDVIVSDEFRKKCNEFYIDMFGYKEPVIYRTNYGFIMGKNMRSVLMGADITA